MLLSKFNVKIASLGLSRDRVSGRALAPLNLDPVPAREILEAIRNDREVRKARVVKL